MNRMLFLISFHFVNSSTSLGLYNSLGLHTSELMNTDSTRHQNSPSSTQISNSSSESKIFKTIKVILQLIDKFILVAINVLLFNQILYIIRKCTENFICYLNLTDFMEGMVIGMMIIIFEIIISAIVFSIVVTIRETIIKYLDIDFSIVGLIEKINS